MKINNIVLLLQTLNELDSKERPPPTCKVILPNTLSMFLFCKSTRSLHDGLLDLCVRHGLSLPALSIFLGEKVNIKLSFFFLYHVSSLLYDGNMEF